MLNLSKSVTVGDFLSVESLLNLPNHVLNVSTVENSLNTVILIQIKPSTRVMRKEIDLISLAEFKIVNYLFQKAFVLV